MALLSEALTSLVGLALKPLILAKVSCDICARAIAVVVQTWFELLKFALSLHLLILWRLLIWTIGMFSLPVRALVALGRERMLEMQFRRLENELENAIWERKGLEEHLNLAIKERKTMEKMLIELEDEHDEAILKIKNLENEVHNLNHEMRHLKEVQGKSSWNCTGHIDTDYNDLNNTKSIAKKLWHGAINHSIPKTWPYASNNLSENRKIAFFRSIFSAVLSLVVGSIAFQAEDLCMPLMLALLIVVAISLTSVFRLISTIEQKLAFDIIALLSLNWFVLGMLTYPVLPRIAHAIAPLASRFLGRTFVWVTL